MGISSEMEKINRLKEIVKANPRYIYLKQSFLFSVKYIYFAIQTKKRK